MNLDGLLGRDVVYVGATGFLQLSDAALCAQLHRPGAGNGIRCFCPVCKANRQAEIDALHAPQATASGDQPWIARPSRSLSQQDVRAA